MKCHIRLIYLITCLLCVNHVFSQELTFNSLNHNFGTFAEDGGEVSCTFTFKNDGATPVVIVSANSTCGCTVPQYSRKPIAAGEESSIVVTYDPMNRPGAFSKNVEIVLAPTSSRYVLTITGDVIPRTKSVEELYPFDMGGGLRISANYYPFSHIEQGGRAETQVAYINTSRRAITLSLSYIEQSGMLDMTQRFTIAAGASGNLAVAYDLSKEQGRYGVLSDRVAVDINDKRSKYPLIFNAHAIDKFSTDDRSAPPICNTSTRTVKLGEVKKGVISGKQSVEIENLGVRDLIIRNVLLGDNIKSSLKNGIVVKAGETLSVDFWIDSKGVDYGNFSGYASITVNDPDQPLHRVRVTAIIVG